MADNVTHSPFLAQPTAAPPMAASHAILRSRRKLRAVLAYSSEAYLILAAGEIAARLFRRISQYIEEHFNVTYETLKALITASKKKPNSETWASMLVKFNLTKRDILAMALCYQHQIEEFNVELPEDLNELLELQYSFHGPNTAFASLIRAYAQKPLPGHAIGKWKH